MSIKTYIPFACKILVWVGRALISLSGKDCEIVLIENDAYTIKLVKDFKPDHERI